MKLTRLLRSSTALINCSYNNHTVDKMAGLIALLVIILFLLLRIWWFRRRVIIKKQNFLKTVPAPSTSLPFFGVALDFPSTEVVLDKLMKYMETYGPLVTGKIGPFRQLLLVADYKLLEHVLSSTKLIVKSDHYYFLRPWLGTGLLTTDGRKWKNHRRVLTPAFHFQILEQFINIFESCGDVLISKFEKNLEENTFNIYPLVTLCSLDVICESIMGVSINAQNDEESGYVKSVKNLCRIAVERALSPIEMHDWLYPFSKNFYTQRKALKILHQQSNNVINARRKELEKMQEDGLQNGEETFFKNKKAFLDILLTSKINGMPLTHEEIREEVDTFMFEGHDTTASALSFILFSLANNSESQKRAFEEQQHIFQGRNDASVTYTDLQNMKYLELVIKESLRLYPSVPIYSRQIFEDTPYGDYVIPQGTMILVFAFGIHRNPNYFENPLEFNPERFENADGKLPYAYIPFSAGPRNCIGQKFAMLEVKSIVSKVLRRFELLPANPEHKVQPIAETILKSANGINIRIKRRQ